MSEDQAFPLHILRKWITEGNEGNIEEKDGSISFNNVSLKLDLQTELKQKNKQAFYNLQQVWFALKHSDLTYSDYIAACQRENMRNVYFADRKEILQWLKGEKPTISSIIEPKTEEVEQPDAQQTESVDSSQQAKDQNENAQTSTANQEATADHYGQQQQKEIELIIEPAPSQTEKHPMIEYERIRTIDSLLLCNYDFSDMIDKNEMLKKQESIQQRARIDDQRRNEFNGREDTSILGSSKKKSNFHNYIILVCRTTKCCINNSNIKEFLTGGKWVPPRDEPKNTHFTIEHDHSVKMKQYKYDVVADERLLTDSDWSKVVAIFVIGKKWQIKNYKPNEPQQLFEKILGIYVGWDQEPIPSDIRTWRIKSFLINQRERHSDPQAINNIWHEIEEATEQLKKRRND